MEYRTKEYTPRVDGVQVRDCVWFGTPSKRIMYDIVKWEKRSEPIIVVNGFTGRLEYSFESCYSLAHLVWNPDEQEFEFEGVGTRWLEEAPSKEACDMILDFCAKTAKKLREEEENE